MLTPSAGTVRELALRVVDTQLNAMLAHEAGTRAGSDPEELHDMRVATRRLRAALKVFEAVLPPTGAALRRELGWLGHGLSTVRDLDVQLGLLAQWRPGLPEADHAGLDGLVTLISAQHEQARQELLALLGSERYVHLLVTAQEFLHAASFQTESSLVEAEVPPLIERSYRKLRKLGDRVAARSPASDLHALRIRAKRLRYSVEFVTDIYGRPARRFLPRVIELQDLLGSHQDAHVAVERLQAMVAEQAGHLSSEVVFVMGGLAQRHIDSAIELRSRFDSTYRRATGQRWQKLYRALEDRQRAARSST